MKTNFTIFLFIILMISSCASPPKGRNVLEEKFKTDLSENFQEKEGEEIQASGRPIYIEAITYPQLIEGGHISIEGKIGVYIGRESIKLNKLLNLETNSLEKTSE